MTFPSVTTFPSLTTFPSISEDVTPSPVEPEPVHLVAFEAVLVARVPQSTGPPSLTVVDRLVTESISYTEELNRPGTATLGCPIQSMSTEVTARLGNLASFPSEVWIYLDAALVWAGEIQTLSITDQTASLACVGLLGYTHRMGVTTDLTYTGIDQFTIAKNLIDHWQGLTFGHYGIDTATVGVSGVVRDRAYLRNELHNIGQRLTELGAVINGFDTRVDPATRALILTHPQSGSDLTASVFLDERNIDSANIAVSVAPDDLVSDIGATGNGTNAAGTNITIYTARSSPAVQETYGRSWTSQTFDGVIIAATLNGHADAYKDARDTQMLQPGVTIVPRLGADIGDFHAGDTVTYSYNAGLGLQTVPLRVAKLTVDVDSSGKQRMRIEAT